MPPDEAPAADAVDTPDAPEQADSLEGAPGDGGETQAPPDDYRQRYESLQPEYTRATQEASEYRKLIDRARQGDPEAISELGLDLVEADDEDEEDDEWLDPEDRIERLEAYLAQQAQQTREAQENARREAQIEQHLADQWDKLEGDHGEIPDEDMEHLLRLADAFSDEKGRPDLIAAYQYDAARLEAKRQGWVSSKKTAQAPRGASASQQIDMDDDEQRREFLAQRWSENQ